MVEFLISYSIGLSFQCVSFVSEYIVIGIQAFRSKDYGYEGILSERVAIIPEILKSNGYRTFMSGKWHIGGDPISPSISIFGSARTKPEDHYFKKTIEISEMISKMGFGIISGAGPGIMEAANMGAKKAKGKSID